MKTISAELPPRQLLLVQRACQLMTRDFSTELSLQQLCQSVGASRSKLSRLFRQYCGCGAISWLREQKMQQACHLLEHSDLSVCEIAVELGFYDSAFFCKTFKTKFGTTPLKYRQSKNKQ